MVERSRKSGGGLLCWRVRPKEAIEAELSLCYGVPIDIAGKLQGLECVAAAFEKGDAALARIAAVQVGFPDPPSLAKGCPVPKSFLCELQFAGLLKDWDPTKHPRSGEKPNPGWFADVPKTPKTARSSRWPSKTVSRKIREFAKKFAEKAKDLVERGAEDVVEGAEDFVESDAPEIAFPEAAELLAFKQTLEPEELNAGEDRALAQLDANFDPPKTLEELQKPPQKNVLGYDRHHIVEQNPANIEKDVPEESLGLLDKFGRRRLDDQSNLAWVPRLKHEKITAYYNSLDHADPFNRRLRTIVKGMDFEQQRQFGLKAMREFGVLK